MAAFTQRFLSAAALIPLVLAAVWAGGIWLGGLLLAVSGLMAKEWIEICFSRGFETAPWSATPHPAAVVVMTAVLLAATAASLGFVVPALVVALAGAILVGVLTGGKRGLDDLILAFGVLYITLPVIALMYLHEDSRYGIYDVYWVLAMVWATDSGAYAAGVILGGPRLAPAISPNKTWAGLLGGVAATGAAAVAAASFGLVAGILWFLVISVAISLVAQAGDLLESAIKRRFDVKDSGTIIPGHGGVLDRLDGLLAAFPFIAFTRLWIGNGEFIWR